MIKADVSATISLSPHTLAFISQNLGTLCGEIQGKIMSYKNYYNLYL